MTVNGLFKMIVAQEEKIINKIHKKMKIRKEIMNFIVESEPKK